MRTQLGIGFLVFLLIVGCGLLPVIADSVTATKTENPDGTHSTSGSTHFELSTAQTIRWDATHTDDALGGNDFCVHRAGELLNDICFETNLGPGYNSGTYALAADEYDISIEYFGMGTGTYTIEFDLTAAIDISPDPYDFGDVLEGETAGPVTFTIHSTGDWPVTITGISVMPTTHFEILPGAPIGDIAPPDRTFEVRCIAGSVPGVYGATITVTGTSEAGPVAATALVECTVVLREPDICCAPTGTPHLGTADPEVPEVIDVSRSFENQGTEDLLITSISVVNDSLGDAFEPDGIPSTAPLDPSDTRDVDMTFAPTAEMVYYGHLVIHSNDPDEPVKECPFRAIGHHPVPIMRVEETLLDYGLVELGFEYTKAIIVHNDGDATLEITLSDIAPPDDANWPSREMGDASIDPGDPPAVFRQVYEPQSLGAHSMQMEVTGNDPVTPSETITLIGEGIAPIPIDSVLILDRSGSMAEVAGVRRKIEALQTAADLFTHLLRPETGAGTGDKLGFVRYNNVNDIYLPLDFLEETATPGSHLAAAEDVLSDAAIADLGRLAPDNATGIGGAMETAAEMLRTAPDRGAKHVMVVLTDGKENRPPMILTVKDDLQLLDSDLMMYSVGLGTSIEPEKLQAITNAGPGGYHQVTDDLSGESIFDLEQFYFKIFANAHGLDLVVDPTHAVSLDGSSPIVVDTAIIISSDRSAIFLVLDLPELRAFYDLELVNPNGQVIVLGTTVGGVPVHHLSRHNYSIYRVVFPDVEQAYTYVGNWTLRLTPNEEWNPEVLDVSFGNFSMSDFFLDPKTASAPIGFAAAVASNYRLAVDLLPSSYLPGAVVTMTARLSDRGWPAVDGEVDVDVTTPSGTEFANIPLYDDGTHGDVEAGDGTWTSRFIQTAEPGSYEFFFHAIGRNERGELAPRQATRYVTLTQPSDGPRDDPCVPCWLLRWWMGVVLGLLLLIFICCCLRRRWGVVGKGTVAAGSRKRRR